MRILVDTNILFSALIFPESLPAKALDYVIEHHKVVLCNQNITELKNIVNRKVPQSKEDVDEFLQKLSFEKIFAGKYANERIRDATDQPILNAAIQADVDIILTGDKDFLSMNLDHPRCLTVAQFLESEWGKKQL